MTKKAKSVHCAKILTYGIQKGGACKTTSCAISGFLLAEKGYKVLLVDADPQGNQTEIWTGRAIREYREEDRGGILAALEAEPTGSKTREQIIILTDNIHLLMGNEMLGVFPRPGWHGDVQRAVENMLAPVVNDYDFILIDTAPALNYLLTSCICASVSGGVVALFEAGKFCYSALFSFIETIEYVQTNGYPDLRVLGILCSLIDNRRTDNKDFLSYVQGDEYLGDHCFRTVISRQAAAGRLAFTGFFNNPELELAIKQYRPFIKELLERVNA
ncbi:chromosome partitioning protein [Anaerospora hongkongensis]|uniref:Chromosome partitioning protein n=1 Tax=Anaerospora hongkongensis TaxID=244830 RepID=A0A4R1PLV9_9FIRM|nr:ParA family protein [Anaerospora hongkongensis]TCL32216.1 chromosome partitioning protein [Anaerospora hongkongensis]